MEFVQPILNTMRQSDNQLVNTFFSNANMNTIQVSARNTIRSETGLSIDRQDRDDLSMIMRYIYITNVYDPYAEIQAQMKLLNERVHSLIVGQIRTGLSSRIGYLRDISRPVQPIPLPITTSLYGNKIPFNDKIGL